MAADTEKTYEEAFAKGYRKAQQDAAYLFGALAYEQANKAMMERAQANALGAGTKDGELIFGRT